MRIAERLLAALILVCALAAAQATYVNIQDFGAVPNDGNDDSAAIQAAFDSLDRVQGGTVLCPAGTYDVLTPIVVRGSGVRFIGNAGPSYNEDPPYVGCTLVARTNGMTLLRFGGGSLDHHGPGIEFVNFRDGTPAGPSATLLEIYNFNRWTVRNVTVNYASTGLKVTGLDDASWGYISQLFCKNSITCLDQSTTEGGFLITGGGLEPLATGVRVRGSQVRIVGVKFDCVSGSTGVEVTGHATDVTASSFEQCGIGILVRDDGTQRWNGDQNHLIGNHFNGSDVDGSRGISLGPGADGNQLIGNTYEYPDINVEDNGSNNLRIEQGVGIDKNLSCPQGQAIRALQVRQGIVTGATCGQI
ncbi:MAG TPA: glycosyl hydrolase family 28-related protein [Bryobacteraceae bacterium]|nr:glycosyl hydrolase family 28-related protein [Bryobacteraceae bacterium]